MEPATARRPRYAVTCSILFTELPLLERPAAACSAGFEAIEMWWPFSSAVPDDAEVERFDRAIQDSGVQIADAPGPHEPGTGTLPLLRQLEDPSAGGYGGWVGLEYQPSSTSDQSFAWLSHDTHMNH